MVLESHVEPQQLKTFNDLNIDSVALSQQQHYKKVLLNYNTLSTTFSVINGGI